MCLRTETFTVEKSLPSGRLDAFLREKFAAVSRVALKRLIEQGHVRVNGHTVKPTHSPRAGEHIEIHWPEARPAEAQPEEIPLDILDRKSVV
jgi:23S rRNA pseudouridine1911/1915/1917 synthase